MIELIAAALTTIDIVVVFSLIEMRKGKFVLAFLTAMFNMIFPFLGFFLGDLTVTYFSWWSELLSSLLLTMIGLHMLLYEEEMSHIISKQLPPIILALAVSLDTLSVSVSFGMLRLNPIIFIISSGILSFIFSYTVLRIRNGHGLQGGKSLKKIAGFSLMTIGIISWFS